MQNTKSLPTVTIIILTKNVEKKLPYTLSCIELQDYPRHKISIIAVDGKSTDNTLNILKSSNLPIVIVRGKYPNDQEARRIVGMKHAKGEILAYIDADNYMPHKSWLRKMVEPFIKHPEVVGTFTLRYGYRKEDILLNRYIALLGSGDPVDFYLNKGERLSYAYDLWNRYGIVLTNDKNYFIVCFELDKFPTLGANGFLSRRKIWGKTKIPTKKSIHVDVAYELALMGHQTYAIVNDSIIHDTADSTIGFIKKRASYINYYQTKINDRLYKVFDIKKKSDVLNLLKFVFFSLTIVQPLSFAIRGYFKKRDIAWFFHPIYCFAIAIIYSVLVTIRVLKSRVLKLFSHQ